MPTKRQIENAHMRGAYLALAFTNSMTWREIEDLFSNIPSGTMKHNMLRAKRSCAKDGIASPTLRELLLHAEEAPRGGAEARLIYPVGSAVSETLKERAVHHEGRKEVGLKQIVEEASAATGVKIALSTAVRILKDHHGIQKRGPNKKRKLDEKTASVERPKSARKKAAVREQSQRQYHGPDDDLLANTQGTANGEVDGLCHDVANQQIVSDGYCDPYHDTGSTKDYTDTNLDDAPQDYIAADQRIVAGDSETTVQQHRLFQFAPSNQFPLYDLSVTRHPYQAHDSTENHDDSFSDYIDPNLNSTEQENEQRVS